MDKFIIVATLIMSGIMMQSICSEKVAVITLGDMRKKVEVCQCCPHLTSDQKDNAILPAHIMVNSLFKRHPDDLSIHDFSNHIANMLTGMNIRLDTIMKNICNDTLKPF